MRWLGQRSDTRSGADYSLLVPEVKLLEVFHRRLVQAPLEFNDLDVFKIGIVDLVNLFKIGVLKVAVLEIVPDLILNDQGKLLRIFGVEKILVPLECLRQRLVRVVDRRIDRTPPEYHGLQVVLKGGGEMSQRLANVRFHGPDVTGIR